MQGCFRPQGCRWTTSSPTFPIISSPKNVAMLGRLILPVSKLPELEAAASDFLKVSAEVAPWRISVLAPPIENDSGSLDSQKFDAALDTIGSFNERHRNGNLVIIDAMEVQAPTVDLIQATIQRLPDRVISFLEIPDLSHPEPMIQAISEVQDDRQICAKIRTGSVVATLIPPPSDVARFIAACAKHQVGFKATAGLHHPVRGNYRLTYEENAPRSQMFGFLNVFFASVFAFEHGVSEDLLIDILSNEDASRFGFDDHNLKWDNLEVSAQRVAEHRQRGIISFGSCSFVEPTTELQLLPNALYASVFSD